MNIVFPMIQYVFTGTEIDNMMDVQDRDERTSVVDILQHVTVFEILDKNDLSSH